MLVSWGAHQHVPNSRQSPSHRVALVTRETARNVSEKAAKILAQLTFSNSQLATCEGGEQWRLGHKVDVNVHCGKKCFLSLWSLGTWLTTSTWH